MNRNKRGWILTSGLAVLVLACVVYLQTGDLGRNDMLFHGVYAIDAPALFRDYRESQSVTAARLTGKQVQVSGGVVSLERDDRNNLVLSLNSGDAVLPVDMFMLPSEEATVSRLTQGDRVFVQCTECSFYLEVLSGNGCVLNAGAEQSSSYRIRGDGRALNDTLRTQAGEGQVVLPKLRHFTLLDTLFVVKDAHAERAMADKQMEGAG